ncbi:MAG TPA: glycosyltransferase [Methanobacteriaceae archaeon]|nr:glycosyltransferase [Methanobacteriaceae archaeon]
MKALLFVTGRGVGGDAVIALNTARALSEKGFECEFALDHQATGYLFEKNGISWHNVNIPQAGGHAASRITILKAGVKTLKASREAAKLCRDLKPDIVVGIIGGGAIIGCTAARMARIPAVGMVATPTDSKIVSQMTTTIALPESPLFGYQTKKNVYSSYLPINPNITGGNKENALKYMPADFNKNLPTILFSSGSTLFEKMAKAPSIIKDELDANFLVVGAPLEKEYEDYLESVMHLGYVDNLPDLYQLADLVVLSDDGLMIHEALACQLPTIALTHVKYDRYHNMASIFPGAVIESDLRNLKEKICDILRNKEEIEKSTQDYASKIIEAPSKIAEVVYQKYGEYNF